ncbi:FecR family protein [Chitinophaga ginsengisoli]|uniref:FecR family protein n=1 Tax=Chitinophaga ginsengisoli TaxID=363837 RepID=A0A2P8G4Y2_9BACT|nr:FecR family protein [Chitinophaga ginsengisoli]PSL29040.1 FecR family protein [Chitinophaga ginsengisoli]
MKSDQEKLKEILSSSHRSAEDEQWLQSYLESTDAAELRGQAADIFRENLQQGTRLPQDTSMRMWDKIQQRVDAIETPILRPYRKYQWLAAAVLVLAAIAYPLFRKQSPKPLAVVTPIIKPGGNKAVLTLADGSKVTLTDTGNQVIKTGSMAIQQKQGELQYENQGNEANAFNELTTPPGAVFQVSFPDGSHAWLNAASSLKYPLKFKDNRTVILNGQAYFEIAPNAKQPFIVKVGEMEVQVLGTSFDIMAYKDEEIVNTTLVEGGVKVSQGSTSALLHPGQQSTLDPATGKMEVQAADLENVLAWRNGKFELENTGLPAFLRQLARWYDIEIAIEAPAKEVAVKKFGGQIGRDMNLQDVLKILELYGIECKLENRKLRVISVHA